MRQLSLPSLVFLAIAAAASQEKTTTLKDYTENDRIPVETGAPVTKSNELNSNLTLLGNNNDDLIGESCECKCKCCLQPTISCDSYCVCIEGKRSLQGKCLGGLLFNGKIENCDYPNTFKCEQRPKPPPTFKCLSYEGLYEFPGNCSIFIQCAHGLPNVIPCPSNLHFCKNCHPPECRYRSEAKCTAEVRSRWVRYIQKRRQKLSLRGRQIQCPSCTPLIKTIPSRLASSRGYHGISAKERLYPVSTTQTAAETTSRLVKRSVSELPCHRKYGFFPVLGRPNSFYKCEDGFPSEERQCPDGLTFNPTVSACSKF